jgi:acyl-CoA thioester hydrolase
MDAFGHVNNVQVLRLLEEVRVRAFEQLVAGGPSLLETGVLVARHEVDYLLPLQWRLEPVPVEMWVTHIGGASFDVHYEVFDEPADAARRTYVHAATTVVAFDISADRTRRLTDAEREVLESWRDAPLQFRRRTGA